MPAGAGQPRARPRVCPCARRFRGPLARAPRAPARTCVHAIRGAPARPAGATQVFSSPSRARARACVYAASRAFARSPGILPPRHTAVMSGLVRLSPRPRARPRPGGAPRPAAGFFFFARAHRFRSSVLRIIRHWRPPLPPRAAFHVRLAALRAPAAGCIPAIPAFTNNRRTPWGQLLSTSTSREYGPDMVVIQGRCWRAAVSFR